MENLSARRAQLPARHFTSPSHCLLRRPQLHLLSHDARRILAILSLPLRGPFSSAAARHRRRQRREDRLPCAAARAPTAALLPGVRLAPCISFSCPKHPRGAPARRLSHQLGVPRSAPLVLAARARPRPALRSARLLAGHRTWWRRFVPISCPPEDARLNRAATHRLRSALLFGSGSCRQSAAPRFACRIPPRAGRARRRKRLCSPSRVGNLASVAASASGCRLLLEQPLFDGKPPARGRRHQ